MPEKPQTASALMEPTTRGHTRWHPISWTQASGSIPPLEKEMDESECSGPTMNALVRSAVQVNPLMAATAP
jgi:hypothetical protein